MKLKLLHLVLCCLLATSAFAHRDDYFRFTMGDNPANDGWTITGGTGEALDGLYVVMADASGTVTWTRDLKSQPGEKNQPYVSQAILKFISGTDTGGEAHVVPKVILKDEEGNALKTFVFETAPDNLELQVCDTAKVEMTEELTKEIRYIDVTFENMKEGEMVSFNYIDLISDWFMPELRMNDTIYIQAEDYDEFWINNRKAYSPIGGGANSYRNDDADLYVAFQDDGAFFQSWTLGHGHKDNWYGMAVKNMTPSGSDWMTYKGDYVDGTSNIITAESAKKNWGAWLEYTFDVPEDCVADISLKIGTHWLVYSQVGGVGTGNFGKSREEGGYVVEGMAEDWVKKYCATVVTSLDGNNLTTNWSSYPKLNGHSQLEYAALASDPYSGWTSTQVLKDGNLVNSDTLFIYPNPRSGDPDNGNPMVVWSTYYKSELYKELAQITGDESLNAYIKPDYADVPLTKGRHTLKVQSLAPMMHFDEIRITAKKGTVGIEKSIAEYTEKLVVYPSPATDVLHIKGIESNYAIIDLRSGATVIEGFGNTVDVSGLSAGVYAVRVGTQTQSFIKK